MNTLVTGGAGFIGSHVARHCLALGHRVLVLDDLSGGCLTQVPEGAEFVQGSVVDRDMLAGLFNRCHFDYVYHLAAYAAEGLSHFVRHFNYTNNLIGSINLINESARHEVRCFVFTSSIAVYGANQVPMREDLTPRPEDPYGIAKYAVEMDLQAAHRLWGLNSVVFRPHNVYGEHQNTGDRYRNVIGIFMAQIMRGEPMTIFGGGGQTRAFSYIDDVAPYIARSVHVPDAYNQVINIGAEEPCSVYRLAILIADAFGISPQIRHLPPRVEVVHAFADHSKARRLFDIASTVPLDEGIRKMASWVRRSGVRASQSPPTEVDRGLPDSWR